MPSIMLDKIKAEVQRLKDIESKHNWKDVRDLSGYMIREIYFECVGLRINMTTKNQKHYEDLQASRGLSFTDNIEHDMLKLKHRVNQVSPSDIIRLTEIKKLIDDKIIEFEQRVDKHKIAECGFRFPSILQYFTSNGFSAKGFDIVDINIMIANYLGYNVMKYDFNDCSQYLDLNDTDLVINYHMLEHLSNPLKAIQKIYSSMKHSAYLHVEVPIESGLPKLYHGHLFAFQKNDLYQMLATTGFQLKSEVHGKDVNRNNYDRILAYKP